LLGILDLLVPDDFILSFFYLLPIAFTTWFAGKRGGIAISLVCTYFLSANYLKMDIVASAWNIVSTLGIFVIVTLMQDKIHQLFDEECKLARTDPLTGAINQRAFLELVGYEIMRLQRENIPYSLVYIDIDNFKMVNDQYGHKMGDEVLKSVATCLLKNHRKTDVVSRMGGDEFTIFFPETNSESVKVPTQRIKKFIDELSKSNGWPTTISMGVITCTKGVCDLGNIVSLADSLMYKVKNSGKNDVMYSEYFSAGGIRCQRGL